MKTILIVSMVLFACGLLAYSQHNDNASYSYVRTPLPPDTGSLTPETTTRPTEAGSEERASAQPSVVPTPSTPTTDVRKQLTAPVRVSIPSIHLNTAVIPVSLTENGDMDVPSGNTSLVGWYADGTLPGALGSAVMDAHVFAAFKKLRYVKVGDSIYVRTKNNELLRFIVRESTVYKVSEVPANRLFNASDAKRLNLITCAGKLTPDKTTYDHRLVVYAELADA